MLAKCSRNDFAFAQNHCQVCRNSAAISRPTQKILIHIRQRTQGYRFSSRKAISGRTCAYSTASVDEHRKCALPRTQRSEDGGYRGVRDCDGKKERIVCARHGVAPCSEIVRGPWHCRQPHHRSEWVKAGRWL